MNKIVLSVAIGIILLAGLGLAQNAVPTIPAGAPMPVSIPVMNGIPGGEARLPIFPSFPWDTNALADSQDYSNPPDGALFVIRKSGMPDSSIILLGYNYYTGSSWLGRVARSTNSGRTYTPSTIGNGFYVDVCVNGNGRDSTCFLSILSVGSNYNLFLRRSTDFGVTWSDTIRVDRGTSTFTDKPMFKTAGNYFYCTYTDFTGGTNWVRMCRSSDWGQTWNTGDVNVSSAGGTGSCPAVAPNGDVYVIWGQPVGWVPTSIWFNRSTDHGATWGTAHQIVALGVSSHLNGWRANHPFPAMVVDSTGKIYATVQNMMHGTGWDICVMTSTDTGQTWSTPVRVNDDTNTDSDQYSSWITLDQYQRPHVFWYDSRDYYPTNSGDVYYTYSNDGGETWSPNERVNDLTPVWTSGSSNQTGDYQQIDCDSLYVYCEWSDHRHAQNSWSYISAARRPLPEFTGVAEPNGGRPVAHEGQWQQSRFELAPNSPNPVVTGTDIAFSMDRVAPATLRVYDRTGRLVRNLFDRRLSAGDHRVHWDGADAAGRSVVPGVYFYRLDAPGLTATRQLVVAR